MKEELEDRVDAYLLDEMTEEERRQFEMDAENDIELKKELEFTRNVQKALQSRAEKLIAINRWERNLKDKKEKEDREYAKKIAIRHRIYWISGIAAIFVAGFFFFDNLLFYNSAPSLSDEEVFAELSPGTATFRGVGVDDAVEELLAQGDYAGALAHIDEQEKDIYIELSLLEREKNARGTSKKATPTSMGKSGNDISFRGKEKSTDLIFGKTKQEQEKKTEDMGEQEAIKYKQELLSVKQEGLAWLKVQALIGLGRIEEAILLLDKIRNSDSEYKEQADSLYNVLKERK